MVESVNSVSEQGMETVRLTAIAADKWVITDIVWETDGEEVGDLPPNVIFFATVWEERVLEALSDHFGWLISEANVRFDPDSNGYD